MAAAVGFSGGEESVMVPNASNLWSHTREVASWYGEEFPAMEKQTWLSLTETWMPDGTLTRSWTLSLYLSHNESVLVLYCNMITQGDKTFGGEFSLSILSVFQRGFRPGHYCVSRLLITVHGFISAYSTRESRLMLQCLIFLRHSVWYHTVICLGSSSAIA